MVGVLAAWSLLLALAGLGKVLRPRPAAEALRRAKIPAVLAGRPLVRLSGLAEILIALGVFVVGGPLPAALVSGAYLLLTAIAWRMLRVSPGQDCGCFGRPTEPVTRWHLSINTAGIVIGAAAVIWPQPSVLAELVEQDATGRVLLVTLTALLTWLCYLTMTALPALLESGATPQPQETQPQQAQPHEARQPEVAPNR